jgi:hypothetical protein
VAQRQQRVQEGVQMLQQGTTQLCEEAHQHDFGQLGGGQDLAVFLAPLPVHGIPQQLVDVDLCKVEKHVLHDELSIRVF